MNWEERNPERLTRIRSYVLEFARTQPGIFSHFRGGSDPIFPLEVGSDRGVGMLLFFCSLFQNISERRLVRVLAYLWKQYDQDLFRINRIPFADLQARLLALTDLEDWPLLHKAPGILRSVGDFFFRHGRLVPWVYSMADGEKSIATLSEEIFLMGKTSAFRSKARYFLWLLTQLDGVDADRFWTSRTRLTLTLGHSRFLHEIGPLKGRKTVPWITPAEKLDWFNGFYRRLFPSSPWLVFSALDAYLRPVAGPGASPETSPAASGSIRQSPQEWQCRKVLQGCNNCPLVSYCPGGDV